MLDTDTDTEITLTARDCLDFYPYAIRCKGAVEYRMALSGSGTPFPRCDHHWDERLDREDEIRSRYPTHEPADFDPSYAGESWDEDY